MKIAIGPSSFASVNKTPLKVLKSKGLEVINNPYARKLTENEIIDHLQGVDGLIAGLEPLNSNVFQKSTDLKVIARVGIGMENVDMKSAEIHKIKVSNTPDGPTDAVAEMTLAAALSLSRNIVQVNRALHEKQWEKSIGMGLKNTNLLIVGYGRIGRKVAELFRIMGAQILVCDPFVTKNDLQSGEELLELKDGLKLADIITLHAGGDNPILTETEFKIMKKGAIVLNSARANLIDEGALIYALDSGNVSSAWLDVFWNEPYTGKLTDYEQVLLTPHMSTYSVQCRRDMEMAAVNNLLRDLGIDA
jgi:D-3-phosphoglycerate dehydrogenase / 2-oxoglutarate reductase